MQKCATVPTHNQALQQVMYIVCTLCHNASTQPGPTTSHVHCIHPVPQCLHTTRPSDKSCTLHTPCATVPTHNQALQVMYIVCTLYHSAYTQPGPTSHVHCIHPVPQCLHTTRSNNKSCTLHTPCATVPTHNQALRQVMYIAYTLCHSAYTQPGPTSHVHCMHPVPQCLHTTRPYKSCTLYAPCATVPTHNQALQVMYIVCNLCHSVYTQPGPTSHVHCIHPVPQCLHTTRPYTKSCTLYTPCATVPTHNQALQQVMYIVYTLCHSAYTQPGPTTSHVHCMHPMPQCLHTTRPYNKSCTLYAPYATVPTHNQALQQVMYIVCTLCRSAYTQPGPTTSHVHCMHPMPQCLHTTRPYNKSCTLYAPYATVPTHNQALQQVMYIVCTLCHSAYTQPGPTTSHVHCIHPVSQCLHTTRPYNKSCTLYAPCATVPTHNQALQQVMYIVCTLCHSAYTQPGPTTSHVHCIHPVPQCLHTTRPYNKSCTLYTPCATVPTHNQALQQVMYIVYTLCHSAYTQPGPTTSHVHCIHPVPQCLHTTRPYNKSCTLYTPYVTVPTHNQALQQVMYIVCTLCHSAYTQPGPTTSHVHCMHPMPQCLHTTRPYNKLCTLYAPYATVPTHNQALQVMYIVYTLCHSAYTQPGPTTSHVHCIHPVPQCLHITRSYNKSCTLYAPYATVPTHNQALQQVMYIVYTLCHSAYTQPGPTTSHVHCMHPMPQCLHTTRPYNKSCTLYTPCATVPTHNQVLQQVMYIVYTLCHSAYTQPGPTTSHAAEEGTIGTSRQSVGQ